MPHHVIIGGGPVATNALETIRQFDDSPITIVCDEPAHSRMALPYWLAGQVVREHTMTADDAYFKKLDVDARIGSRVTKVDTSANELTLSNGGTVAYDNLLIATGSSPVTLPIPGTDLPGVTPLWDLAHTQGVLDAVEGIAKPRIAMIGSGFIGMIMLNAMYKRGWTLTVVEREPQILPRMLSSEAAAIAQAWLGKKGVDVHTGTTATKITDVGGAKKIELASGQSIEADVVVIAVGIAPNVDFLEGSGIEHTAGTGGAVPVNDRMQTNVSNVYAGGDIACGPVLFGDDEVHPIQPTAVDHGRIAGANMAGQNVQYPGSLLMNILDVCGLQCASFGQSQSGADAMTMNNPTGNVYRSLVWSGDQLTGAIFVGQANDMGMLTDVGMVKGIMQTQTSLGPWKAFLAENPFDIRRPYVATGVAAKLRNTTLIGKASKMRQYQFGGAKGAATPSAEHAVFVADRGVGGS